MTDFLTKYNPHTPLFDHFQVDPNLPKSDRAFASWKALLSAKRSHEGLFLVIGKILKDFRDEKLFELLDYENFSQFLASEELGFSRDKAYMTIKIYEYYIEYLELNPDNVAQMNISRLALMVPILKRIEDKTEAVKQIEQMNGLRHGDFIREVKSKTNLEGKPAVFWSEELSKWIVSFHPNITHLQELDDFQTTQG